MKLENYRLDHDMTFAELAELIGLGRSRAKDAERYCKGVTKPTNMRRIYEATKGKVAPNDFYDLPEGNTDQDGDAP